MADKKKMSVEEMLAFARAEKSGGAKPAPAATPTAAAEPAAPVEAASAESAPAKSAAKPVKGLSVADMLAAARGEKSGASKAAAPAETPKPVKAEPKAAPKPAAVKEVAAKEAAEKPAGPVVKDTASILAAARGVAKPGPVSKSEVGKVAETKPGKVKLAVPPMPEKPAYARAAPPAPAVEVDPSRRGFLATSMAVMGAAIFQPLALGFT